MVGTAIKLFQPYYQPQQLIEILTDIETLKDVPVEWWAPMYTT